MAEHCADPTNCPTNLKLAAEKESRQGLEEMFKETIRVVRAGSDAQIETNTKLEGVVSTMERYQAKVDKDIDELYSKSNETNLKLVKKLSAGDIVKYATIMLTILTILGGFTVFILKITVVMK